MIKNLTPTERNALLHLGRKAISLRLKAESIERTDFERAELIYAAYNIAFDEYIDKRNEVCHAHRKDYVVGTGSVW